MTFYLVSCSGSKDRMEALGLLVVVRIISVVTANAKASWSPLDRGNLLFAQLSC